MDDRSRGLIRTLLDRRRARVESAILRRHEPFGEAWLERLAREEAREKLRTTEPPQMRWPIDGNPWR